MEPPQTNHTTERREREEEGEVTSKEASFFGEFQTLRPTMLKRAAKQVGAGFWSQFDSTREAGRCHKIKILKKQKKLLKSY